jgi:hypothetical protein
VEAAAADSRVRVRLRRVRRPHPQRLFEQREE